MNLIEQAAQRLAELSRAGVPTPFVPPALDGEHTAAGHTAAEHPADRGATPARESTHRQSEVRSIRSVRDAASRRSGRLSEVVELDLKRMEDAGYLVPSRAEERIADEFRHLKRVLMRNVEARSQDPQRREALIMVTSALAGEGKTYCTINLAMSMAMEIDRSVLLVDVDVIRPAVMQRLGLRQRRGLLDVLSDPQADLADAIVRTNIPKLSILPTGTLTARASELLASVAMDDLLDDLATSYSDRVIVFDAPPLLLTTGASTLASRMGQIVMVVEAQQTARHTVMQAFAALEDCPIVLSVLNKCPPRMAARSFGYYGGPSIRRAGAA